MVVFNFEVEFLIPLYWHFLIHKFEWLIAPLTLQKYLRVPPRINFFRCDPSRNYTWFRIRPKNVFLYYRELIVLWMLEFRTFLERYRKPVEKMRRKSCFSFPFLNFGVKNRITFHHLFCGKYWGIPIVRSSAPPIHSPRIIWCSYLNSKNKCWIFIEWR